MDALYLDLQHLTPCSSQHSTLSPSPSHPPNLPRGSLPLSPGCCSVCPTLTPPHSLHNPQGQAPAGPRPGPSCPSPVSRAVQPTPVQSLLTDPLSVALLQMELGVSPTPAPSVPPSTRATTLHLAGPQIPLHTLVRVGSAAVTAQTGVLSSRHARSWRSDSRLSAGLVLPAL